MKRIPVSDATVDQIRAFAMDRFKLEIHHNTRMKAATAKLAAVWGNDWIEVPDAEAEGPAAEDVTLTQADALRIVELVTGGMDQKEALAKVSAEAIKRTKPVTVSARPPDSKAFYVIEIPLDPRAGQDQIVQTGVNGRPMIIKRGVPSEVRAPYLGVLRDAVERQDYQEDPDDVSSPILTAWVPAYPHTIIEGPYWKDEHGNRIAA